MIALVSLAWGGAASDAAAPPVCDAMLLGISIEALDTASDDSVAPLMAADLQDACRFDADLAGAVALAVDQSRDLDVLSKPWLDWVGLRCPDAGSTAWEACSLREAGLTTEEGWAGAKGFPLLALRVHESLLEGGVDADTAQIVFRRLAGISRTAPDEVIRRFSPLFD